MSFALEAVAWSVGTLAVFGVIMTGLNVLATRGVPGVQVWVEERSPIIYGMTITAVLVVLVASGRLDPVAFLVAPEVLPVVGALAAAPLVALAMYVLELYLSSRTVVRPGGMITTPNAQEATLRLTARPGVWWGLAAVSAVVEELIFRGLLLSALAAPLGWWPAIAVSALIFGLHHVTFGPVSIVSKSVGGVLLALQVLLAGTVLPAIVAHLLFQGLVWRRLRRRGQVQ